MLMSFRRFGARRRVVAEDCCDRRARLLIRTRPLQYPQHLLCLGRQGIDVQNLAVARLGQLNVTFPLMLQSLLEKFLQTLLRRKCACNRWVSVLRRKFRLMDANEYDLVVIGSGPAGQKSAICAAKLRKKVA